MHILAFIQDEEVIEKTLKYLGLWGIKARPAPKITGKTQEYHLDESTLHLLAYDKWFYVDPEYLEAYSFDREALDRPT